jgi:two-component system, chemotaxis family, chemotaxis protein CheY
MKIITIDDSGSMRSAISNIIEALGHNPVEACDGLEGLAAVKENPDIQLILLDREMPNMDGLEFLLKIATLPDLGEIPIIMVSSRDDRTHIVEALRGGARDFLPKPFTPEMLSSKIAEYCPPEL